MIKRTGVRKMACVSFLVIFCVCFLVTGTARAAEPNTVSRGEWIQRLVSTFQMTVEDHTTMPDNYFSDLSSEDTYYSDILTAVEFGVIDLEAGEPFQPDSPATREFAAQTLNFCLGFQIDEETYTYIDSNETAYPEDAQVAINRGWFVLVNGAFCPDQPITPSEMQGMLADAQSVLTSDATGEIQSDFTVAEGVIVIPETAQVSVDMEDTLTIVGYEGTIHTGDVFVVTFGGFPVAYQAGNVQEENGTLVIQGLTGEATENAISEAHISGTSEADLGNFEPAEETTYYITDQNKGANAPVETLRIAPRGIEYDKGAKTLTIIEDVKLNQATAGSLTVVMSNIETDHDVDGTLIFVTSAHFSLESDLSVTASIRFDLSSYAGIPSSLPLGGINLGVAKLTLAMNYDLSGGIAANWTGSLSAGISYRAGDGVRIIKNFQKDVFSMVADVELRVGVRALAEFNLIELVKGSAWAGVGVQGNASYTYYDTGTPETCETISGYLYAEVGYSARILWDSYGDTVVLYNERNSPVRVYYHYENGVMVDHCSRDSSSYPYYTGVNSPYFNPGPGHASGSYELGGVVRATFTYEVKTDNETGKQYASITGYTGNPSVLVIPSEIDGYSVQMISSQAFEGKTSLRAVTIPDSVTEIGSSAFADCTNLQNVELSKGLVSLDSNAFNGCVSLLEIEIPKSLTQVSLGGTSSSLTNGVFGGSGLTTVRFEQGMTRVPEYLFRNATHLQNVEFLDTMTTIESGAFVRCTSLTEVDLPESLTSIEGTVFEGCTGLTAIDIPDTVTSIGSSAFADCTNLQDVQLPKGLVSLDGNVFNGCISLLEIEIPKSLASVFLGGTSDSLTNGVFGRSGLTTVRFEQGMTKVPEYLFMNATHLQNVEFLDTMTTIESGAFVRCTSLTEVVLPESLTSIEGTAFEGCTGLTAIDIPDAVTAIGSSAFADCTNLQNVELSKGLVSLDGNVFNGCISLLEIEIPKSLASVFLGGTSDSLTNGVFGRSGLTTVRFEQGMTKVPEYLFMNATHLQNVEFLDTMTTIESGAFVRCTSLTEVDLPESLIRIEGTAFEGCTGLTAIDIPDTVTAIGIHAFEDCTNLKDVHLPKNLATLSSYLFRGCSAMQVIELPPTLEEIEDAAFENSGMVSIEIPGNCATLGNDVFADCVSLKEAVLEPGVKSIGNNCFDGCTALETVSLPEGLTTIRDFAFRNCDALTAVEVPDSVTTLETYAFSSCDSLSDVSLGTGITEIPQYAFYGCPSLQKVTIPYRVTEISGYAFANCTGLTEITIPQSVTTIASTAFSYPDKLTIYGVAGSYAETYANDHSIKFVSRTVPATSVSLNTEELTINRGSTAQLVVNVQPEDFTDSVSWKSANTAVATVTDAGVVKAVSVGSTTIRVVVGNISVDCVVTVVQPVTSISLNRTSLTLEAASSFQLVATANPSTAQNREVTWSSSDTSIASVNENGLVTAHKKGTATITAKAVGSNVSRSCTVTVPNNAHVASSVTELESPHPYEDSCSDVWVYTVKDATYLEFTFHESTDIESGFDYLYLYNAAGEEVGRYTGKALAGQTIRIEGNTVKIKLVSDASGSAWGFQVTGLDTDGTVNPYESLLAQMEQLSELTDIDAILSGVKELEQNELTEAMEDQENGTAVLDALTELERATQIETAITVTDEMNTTFKEGDIQVLGAALNIAEVNQGQTNTVTLVVDSAGSDHALSDQYKNGLAFSMHLDNASASLSVPVQIKLPVPSSLESDNLVLFHYKADGSTETVDFTLSQENGQAYATFVLTEFSDFQFANLDYILGDVTGDGRVNGLDVNRLFRYVNGQISLNPQQLASADVTGDSRVNGLDVNRLFRYVNGQITEL